MGCGSELCICVTLARGPGDTRPKVKEWGGGTFPKHGPRAGATSPGKIAEGSDWALWKLPVGKTWTEQHLSSLE